MQCEIVGKFFELLSIISARQKLPMEYTGGKVLYHAEMELLQQIYENPQANVSILSKILEVTKSAITQMSAKLTEKGLVEKYTAQNNKKEKFFRLTDEGEVVRRAHAQRHMAAALDMQNYLCSLEGRDKKTIMEFMEKMKKCVPVYAISCRCTSKESACDECLCAAGKSMEGIC